MAAKTAKIASKNNPSTRRKAKEYFWNNEQVVPAIFMQSGRRFTGAVVKGSTNAVMDEGFPMLWSKIAEANN